MKKRKVGFLVHPGWCPDCIEHMSSIYDEEIKEYDEVHVFLPEYCKESFTIILPLFLQYGFENKYKDYVKATDKLLIKAKLDFRTRDFICDKRFKVISDTIKHVYNNCKSTKRFKSKNKFILKNKYKIIRDFTLENLDSLVDYFSRISDADYAFIFKGHQHLDERSSEFMTNFKGKYLLNEKVSMYSMGNIELTSFLFTRKNDLDIENDTFTVFGEYGNQCVDYFRRSLLVEFSASLKVNKSKCLFYKDAFDVVEEEHIYSSCDNKYLHTPGGSDE